MAAFEEDESVYQTNGKHPYDFKQSITCEMNTQVDGQLQAISCYGGTVFQKFSHLQCIEFDLISSHLKHLCR